MKWSYKIGEYAGISVFIHVTFFMLLAGLGFLHWTREHTFAAAFSGVGFIVALFLCVLLHEFGHALAAKRYGIKTRDITLYPIGGIARLERMPDKPLQELWVAIAGPLVNVAIAAGLYVFLGFSRAVTGLHGEALTEGSFLERLMMVNIFLVVFNMLPAFPMDGGRVLRALLATRLDYARATGIAAAVGQGMALLFGLLGFFGNPMLILIAVFVWIGAGQEASMAQMKSALGGIPVSRAMITDFRTLAPNDRLSRVVDLILAGSQHDFPVVDGERVAGVLTRADLLSALARSGQESAVQDVMRRDIVTAQAGDMLEAAFQRLSACECHTVPVLSFGRLVGILTMENVGEFLMIQAAMHRRDDGGAGQPAGGNSRLV